MLSETHIATGTTLNKRKDNAADKVLRNTNKKSLSVDQEIFNCQ